MRRSWIHEPILRRIILTIPVCNNKSDKDYKKNFDMVLQEIFAFINKIKRHVENYGKG